MQIIKIKEFVLEVMLIKKTIRLKCLENEAKVKLPVTFYLNMHKIYNAVINIRILYNNFYLIILKIYISLN